MALWMTMLVCHWSTAWFRLEKSQQPLGKLPRNLVQTFHALLRIHSNDFADPLTFHQAPSSGQILVSTICWFRTAYLPLPLALVVLCVLC